MDALTRIFGVPKPVIAMLHLPALPGRPLHDRAAGLDAAVEAVGRDLEALQGAGVDGLLFCNEADLPYQLRVGHEISAAMASVVGQLRGQLRVPFGVNILWDPIASLAVARATGAQLHPRGPHRRLRERPRDDRAARSARSPAIAPRSAATRSPSSTTSHRSSRQRSGRAGSRTGHEARPSCASTPSSSRGRPPASRSR